MRSVKRLLRYLAEQNYYTAKALWKRGQRKAIQEYHGEPILDYQMGKVGSSTVQASLKALDPDRPVYHVHFLNPSRVREIEQQRKKWFRTDKYGLLRRPWLYEFLFEEIQKKKRHWKVITLIREPIARNLSTFFENLEVTAEQGGSRYAVRSDYYGFDINVDLENLDPLIKLFFERLIHERPLCYFDDEIKYVFGIDVFQSPFPKNPGYRIYRGDNVDMLLIRLENLDQCAAAAFKEFLDSDAFTLVQCNVASEKVYAPLYKELKSRISLPDAYIDKMYDSKYTRHFYSDDEIRGFRERWHRP